jgi:large subunit ribosomal protein L4
MKKLALQAVLAGKLRDGEIVVLNEFSVATPKTKEVIMILKNFNLKNSKVLLVADSVNDTLIKSARIIERLSVTRQSTVNIFDLLTHKKVLMTKKALEEIISRKG